MLSKDFDDCSTVLYSCLESRGKSSRRNEVNCGTNCGIPLELHLKVCKHSWPRAVVVSLLSSLGSRHSVFHCDRSSSLSVMTSCHRATNQLHTLATSASVPPDVLGWLSHSARMWRLTLSTAWRSEASQNLFTILEATWLLSLSREDSRVPECKWQDRLQCFVWVVEAQVPGNSIGRPVKKRAVFLCLLLYLALTHIFSLTLNPLVNVDIKRAY